MFQTLAAVFARYCAFHLKAVIAGVPLPDPSGGVAGHVDRITLHGQRLIIEGWADADEVVVSHANQRQSLTPNLQRADVNAAYPALQSATPGFSGDFAFGNGGASIALIRNGVRFVYPVPLPNARRITRARARLILPFLRDLLQAAPVLLRWYASKDPSDRTRLKQKLRLVAQPNIQGMQPFLFLPQASTNAPERSRNELALPCAPGVSQRAITIVLPVYNAFDVLPEVLNRLVSNTDLPWRLILVEDASTDPAVRPFLRHWVAGQQITFPGQITLIENKENQGFIWSVNTGLMRAIGYGDHVVLLNSDALVPKAWATRLMRPFLVHDFVATVTPMSNDAEIFSAPVVCKRGALGLGQADAIDAVAATLHPDAAIANAPTGVGFCMAMSIDYLRLIPAFDTSFGRGYGEEVDWCQKARALGGRHLGLANLFVEHRGGASFGSPEKQRLIARNNAEISRRYPNYDAEVQAFVVNDPLAAPRLALAIAWAAVRATDTIPIYLAHSMGGGADDYLTDRIARDLPQAALVLRVGTARRWQLELHCATGVARGATDDFALIQRLLAPIHRLQIVYSCGVGDADTADLPARLLALKRGARDSIEVLIHDYLPVSPSYTLLNSAGQYAGPPDPTSPDAAHRQRRPNGAVCSLKDWQENWGKLLLAATAVTTFSQNSAAIIVVAYPDIRAKLRITPHQLLHGIPRLSAPVRRDSPVIGVLGNIGFQKGAAVLRDLSQMLNQTGSAKLIVLGQMDPIYGLAASSQIHGGYTRHDISTLAARYDITDWLIPSIWPETFSYTTHEAIASSLPVWCFDLGAQADAVRAAGKGGVIPIPNGMADLPALLAAILQAHGLSAQFQTESCAA